MWQRIALVFAVLGLGVLLYFLPKNVLNNEDQDREVAQKESATGRPDSQLKEEGSTEDAEDHSVNLDSSSQVHSQELKQALEKADDVEEKARWVDSLAGFYTTKGAFAKAAEYYKEKARLKPGFEQWVKAGRAYAEAASFAVDAENQQALVQEAQQFLQKAEETQPKNLDVKVALAETYVMGENPMQGIFLLREVLQENPEHQKALYQMGILSIQSGQWAKAVERLEKYTQLYEKDPQGWFYLGLSYKELQMKRKARQSFERVKDLDDSEEVQAAVDSYLNEL